jgi:hypothetical protein
MKIYSKYLVIGVMILFFGASVGASVIQNINGDNASKINFNNESYPGQINRAWSDNFDSYETGSSLHGQGGWEAWDDNPATTVYVSDTQSLSSPNSVEIAWFDGNSGDIVQQFTDVNSGNWRFLAWQYVPGDMQGSSFFILLNTYSHGGPYHWSTQIRFSASEGVVADYDDPSTTLPIITDEWVLLRIEIDFEADIQTVYYGGEELTTKSWTAGSSPGGAKNLACVDLYADQNPSTSVYYDDMYLDVPQPLSCDAEGPYGGIIDEDIEFDCTATGGIPPYQYLWDFGDGHTSDDKHPTHNYVNAGNYTVTLTVTDYESDTASDTTWALINGPPNEPRITGKTNVKAGVENCWTFHSEDPNGDQIKYIIDWGDGAGTETDCYPSCTPVEVCHTYTEQGTYTIKAKAKECTQDGLESDWAERIVNVPRNRAYINTPFLRFLQQHPYLFTILQLLLQR